MDNAVALDFDGTIADTDRLQSRSIKEVVRKRCGVLLPMKDVDATFGYPLAVRIAMLAKKRRLDVDALGVEANERLAKMMEKAAFVPGAKQAIAALFKAGIRMCIVSGNAEESINRFIRRNRVPGIELVVGCESAKKKKPDPECYLKAAELLGLPAGECIVVEDSPAGAIAARRAGMKLILVPNPLSHRKDFPKADIVLDGMRALTPSVVRRL